MVHEHSNRKQYVFVNGCSLDLCNVSCGVPQGRFLGPLLGILYMISADNLIVYRLYFLLTTRICSLTTTIHTLFNMQTVNSELSKILQ